MVSLGDRRLMFFNVEALAEAVLHREGAASTALLFSSY